MRRMIEYRNRMPLVHGLAVQGQSCQFCGEPFTGQDHGAIVEYAPGLLFFTHHHCAPDFDADLCYVEAVFMQMFNDCLAKGMSRGGASDCAMAQTKGFVWPWFNMCHGYYINRHPKVTNPNERRLVLFSPDPRK